jgi:hypothetical protein
MAMTDRLPDVTSVRVLRNRVVYLCFDDGVEGEIDLAPTLRGPIFEEIARDDEAFAEVGVEDGTIRWPSGADLAPEVLHEDIVAGRRRPAHH